MSVRRKILPEVQGPIFSRPSRTEGDVALPGVLLETGLLPVALRGEVSSSWPPRPLLPASTPLFLPSVSVPVGITQGDFFSKGHRQLAPRGNGGKSRGGPWRRFRETRSAGEAGTGHQGSPSIWDMAAQATYSRDRAEGIKEQAGDKAAARARL